MISQESVVILVIMDMVYTGAQVLIAWNTVVILVIMDMVYTLKFK